MLLEPVKIAVEVTESLGVDIEKVDNVDAVEGIARPVLEVEPENILEDGGLGEVEEWLVATFELGDVNEKLGPVFEIVGKNADDDPKGLPEVRVEDKLTQVKSVQPKGRLVAELEGYRTLDGGDGVVSGLFKALDGFDVVEVGDRTDIPELDTGADPLGGLEEPDESNVADKVRVGLVVTLYTPDGTVLVLELPRGLVLDVVDGLLRAGPRLVPMLGDPGFDTRAVSEGLLDDVIPQEISVHGVVKGSSELEGYAPLDAGDEDMNVVVALVSIVRITEVAEVAVPEEPVIGEPGTLLSEGVTHDRSEQELWYDHVDDPRTALWELVVPLSVDAPAALTTVVSGVLDGVKARYTSSRSGAPHAWDGLFWQGNVVHWPSDTTVAPETPGTPVVAVPTPTPPDTPAETTGIVGNIVGVVGPDETVLVGIGGDTVEEVAPEERELSDTGGDAVEEVAAEERELVTIGWGVAEEAAAEERELSDTGWDIVEEVAAEERELVAEALLDDKLGDNVGDDGRYDEGEDRAAW
ncbi:MAG: hypothetical protein Q9163_005375 [Psora crenata]